MRRKCGIAEINKYAAYAGIRSIIPKKVFSVKNLKFQKEMCGYLTLLMQENRERCEGI